MSLELARRFVLPKRVASPVVWEAACLELGEEVVLQQLYAVFSRSVLVGLAFRYAGLSSLAPALRQALLALAHSEKRLERYFMR